MSNKMREGLLTGREYLHDPGVVLTAGPVTALLLMGDLRSIRVGGAVVVSRIYLAIRDLDWNTIPGEINDLTIKASDNEFTVRFRSRHTSGEIDFDSRVEITGDSTGQIVYSVKGTSHTAFSYAKIGLCIHHPTEGFAGQPFVGDTSDGSVSGVLPESIAPQIHLADGSDLPLFEPVSSLALSHSDGGLVRFRFAGDLWEMEDQRNWSDASYKSASTPASLGYRHEAAVGSTIEQSIGVVVSGFTAAPAHSDAGPLVRVGDWSGTVMPPIGVGTSNDSVAISSEDIPFLSLVRPAHLRVDVTATETGAAKLRAMLGVAETLGAALEVALTLAGGAGLTPIVAVLRAERSRISRVLVFADGEETTSAETFRAVQKLLPDGPPIVAGTNVYFNELNRHRVHPAGAAGLVWSISPQIHATDDLSIMENLGSQSDMLSSARVFAPETPLFVSPITLKPRFNAVAVTDRGSRLGPAPSDPRQATLFAAAWTLGSLAALAGSGAAGLTYFEAVGDRGITGGGDSGQVFPVALVLADACSLLGGRIRSVGGFESTRVAALATEVEATTTVLLANLTRQPMDVNVHVHGTRLANTRVLDIDSWPTARDNFEGFLARRDRQNIDGTAAVHLDAYSTARMDFT